MEGPLGLEACADTTKQIQKMGVDRLDFAGSSIPHDMIDVSQGLGHIHTVDPVNSVEGLSGVGVIEGKESFRPSAITDCRQNCTRRQNRQSRKKSQFDKMSPIRVNPVPIKCVLQAGHTGFSS
jgi:hypothetical protein